MTPDATPGALPRGAEEASKTIRCAVAACLRGALLQLAS
nr:unnamed protein product [Digitaria exilis]